MYAHTTSTTSLLTQPDVATYASISKSEPTESNGYIKHQINEKTQMITLGFQFSAYKDNR